MGTSMDKIKLPKLSPELVEEFLWELRQRELMDRLEQLEEMRKTKGTSESSRCPTWTCTVHDMDI